MDQAVTHKVGVVGEGHAQVLDMCVAVSAPSVLLVQSLVDATPVQHTQFCLYSAREICTTDAADFYDFV